MITIPGLSETKRRLLRERLKGNSPSASATSPDLLEHRAHDGWAPLSFSQRQIWLIDQVVPGNPAYNLPFALRIRGPLDVRALESGLNEVIKRHEALRTTFDLREEEPVQVIHAELSCPLRLVSLEHAPEETQEAKVKEFASQESMTPFDLTRLPLLRASLLRLAEADHVLVLNVHHIVFDGLSTEVLLKELDLFYRAATTDPALCVPDLPIQYADYARWQQAAVKSKRVTQQMQHWAKVFQTVAPPCELPIDKPRPPSQSFRGANVFFQIPESLARELSAFGAEEGATFFMTMLAAFRLLLHRYTSVEDLVIGTPISDRSAASTDLLIGNLLNILPLRCDLAGNPSFRELLGTVKDVTLQAFANKDVPFLQLVEQLKFSRDPSRNPVFQVLIQVLPSSDLRLGSLEVSWIHFDFCFAQFDLALHLYGDGPGYTGRFEYCTDLFRAETIERLSKNFIHLLHEVVRSPGRRVSEIPILAEAERHQLLTEWNRTAREYPRDRCLHQLFEESASRRPESVALEFEGKWWTYGELNARADEVAARLRRVGIGRNTIVPLCTERSMEMVAAALGILKAGGAYLPLDPHLPVARLEFMVSDSGARLILTEPGVAHLFENTSAKLIRLDPELRELPTASNSADGEERSTPEDLAYVIYTSGSTGKPKGVAVGHRSAVNVITAAIEMIPLSERDTTLAVTTLSFDIAVAELFAPLIAGGRVVVVPRAVASDGSLLLKLLHASNATFLQPTPATWRLLLAAGWTGTPGLKMVSTGEPLPMDLAKSLLPKGEALWNLYGPTETTIWSTGGRITNTDLPPSIGRPLANTTLYVLDQYLQPVPLGVTGELFIGGDGLAREYLNRPELTASCFIRNPFSPDPNSRLYRTRDLVRYREDGSLECLGRLDHQVKIRGFRIELGEIEAQLADHDQVAACVVQPFEASSGEKLLAAYVVGRSGDFPLDSSLKEHLRRSLPEYMVPAVFVPLEKLPLSSNGKVDRKALPTPTMGAGSQITSSGPAKTLLELELLRIWERVLGRSSIGTHDNFFDLGGHSLLATRLAAEIGRLVKGHLPIAWLFQAPTVSSLARLLGRKGEMPPWSSLVPLQPHGEKPPIFFVHGWGGDVFCFLELARGLGLHQPSYGLQAAETADGRPRHSTIEAMAQHYVSEICSLQPMGPYLLCGYSLGGWIAYEIALRLEDAGAKVGMLALLDTHPFQVPKSKSLKVFLRYGRQRFRFHLDTVLTLRGPDRLAYLSRMFRTVRFVFRDLRRSNNGRDSASADAGGHQPLSEDYYYRVAQGYVARRTFSGTVDLITSESSMLHKLCYWEFLAERGVRQYPGVGGHMDLLNPSHVPGLAKVLNQILARVSQTGPDRPMLKGKVQLL